MALTKSYIKSEKFEERANILHLGMNPHSSLLQSCFFQNGGEGENSQPLSLGPSYCIIFKLLLKKMITSLMVSRYQG